ncbi:hypothetical protein COY07_00580 [Candidatus Peregrinibacteria bacterium CG_4_10_14_0_2_um_filter_43_11]|nr:MAG: hypothetical protein COY07_00580 [Candidatus Peregrinibacteria bacterium CG_4_10_14_0_2_um_filter_43_11]
MTDRVLDNFLRKLVYFSPLFFPAYFLRVQFAGVPFTLLELYTYVLFFVWLLYLFRSRLLHWRKPLPLYYLCAALLFLGVSVGVVAAPAFIPLPDGTLFNAQQTALGIWKGWIVAPLLYFLVLTQVLRGREQAEHLLRFFVYSAVMVSLIAYGMLWFGGGITYDLRLSGFYESANYMALYLGPAVLLNVLWVFHHSVAMKTRDYFDIATLVILLYSLFFTQSYAAILAVFGALALYVFYFLFRGGFRAKNAVFGLFSLIALLLFIAVTQFNSPKFKQFLDFENRSSTTVRFEIYQVTLDLIKTHPFAGIGPGLFQANYQNAAPAVLGQAPMEWNIPHPHNIFFAFWLNAGLLGFLSLIFIHLLVHRRFTYPLVAFWGIILHGFFDTPFWKNDLAMVFWLIVASILILQMYGTDSSQNQGPPLRKRLTPRVSVRSRAKQPLA